MKKLMLKDFIKYNSPCFNCRNKVEIIVYSESVSSTPTHTQIRCYVTPSETKIPFKIGYSNSLELTVNHKDNIISSNNIEALLKYFKSHKIHLVSKCSNNSCGSFIESNMLELNNIYCRLQPIILVYECFYLKNIKTKQQAIVTTDFENQTSTISIYDENTSPFTMELQNFNLIKLKTKEKFFEKMKLYLTFS